MNFFETLSATGIKDVVFQVKEDSTGNITVFITPKSVSEDPALSKLKPIFISGTPQDIDGQFFHLITAPLQNIQKVFTNIEAFEAQAKEVAKATADKKSAKKATTTAAASEEDGEEKTPAAKPEKTVKVNNEKVLKEFMTSIKDEPIIGHKEKIEELYALLSEAELGKPFAKKVRIDLDIAIRKEANLQAAREKHGFTPKEETATESKDMKIVDISNLTVQNGVIKEVVNPNENAPQAAGPEEVVATNESENTESIIDAYEQSAVEKEVAFEQVSAPIEEVIIPTPTPPAPVAAPIVPKVPAEPEFEEIQQLVMLVTDGTYEEYIKATWTDELLIEHKKAEYRTVKVPVIKTPVAEAPAQKLSYTFPTQFDAEEEENN